MIRWNDKISQKCQQLFPIKMIECHESNQHLLTRFTMTRANLRKIVAISRKKAAASPSPSKHLNNRIEPYNVKKWKKKNDTKQMQIDRNGSHKKRCKEPMQRCKESSAKMNCVEMKYVWRMELFERVIIIVDLLTWNSLFFASHSHHPSLKVKLILWNWGF